MRPGLTRKTAGPRPTGSDAIAPSPIRPGATLGHLAVDEEIGVGAFGRAHRARDARIVRDVSSRALDVGVAGPVDPEERERSLREARAVGGFHDPSVVTRLHVHER